MQTRKPFRVLVAAITLVLATVAARQPISADAGNATVYRHPVYAYVDALFGTCPDTPEFPPAGTVCNDTYLFAFRSYGVFGGGSLAPPDAPWNVFVETYHLEFAVANEEPIVTVLASGFGELDGIATVDEVHLGTASVDAHVPMSDGSTFNFSGSWQAISERLLFGNDGPATGREHHYTDRCLTFVSIGHQKVRLAQMTGAVDGQPVASYRAFVSAVISSGNFRYFDIPHASCA